MGSTASEPPGGAAVGVVVSDGGVIQPIDGFAGQPENGAERPGQNRAQRLTDRVDADQAWQDEDRQQDR